MPAENLTFTAVYTRILPTGVTIKTAPASLAYKATTTLSADIAPAEAVGCSLKWSTSNGSVIRVVNEKTGEIKAVGDGTATITATVVDADGNAVKDASGNNVTASVQIKCTMTFWQKFVKWLKGLFGIADAAIDILKG